MNIWLILLGLFLIIFGVVYNCGKVVIKYFLEILCDNKNKKEEK
jgi:hypothetical protein